MESFDKNIVNKIDLGKYFYLMKYKEHYQEFLSGVSNKSKVISELFLFRAWTTQFGFRIFSSHENVSEKIIYEVVNLGNTLGKGTLLILEGIDIEKTLNNEFISLLESRWQEYDKVVICYRNEVAIPTRQIISKVCDQCNIKDPMKFVWLCIDFLSHMEQIKKESLSLGILA